jgi:hypothetical protein
VLLDGAARRGLLTWDEFAVAWWRMVRRVVLGDGARASVRRGGLDRGAPLPATLSPFGLRFSVSA